MTSVIGVLVEEDDRRREQDPLHDEVARAEPRGPHWFFFSTGQAQPKKNDS